MRNKLLYDMAKSVVTMLRAKGLITAEEEAVIDLKNKQSFL